MIRLQHDKQKQMRYGTLQKRDTLTLCSVSYTHL
ncbi:rpoE leader peptide RseD, partial [Pseudomonas aeruginosa]